MTALARACAYTDNHPHRPHQYAIGTVGRVGTPFRIALRAREASALTPPRPNPGQSNGGGETMTEGNARWAAEEDEDGFCLQIDMGNGHAIMLTADRNGEPARVTLWCGTADHSFVVTEDEDGETADTFKRWMECTQRRKGDPCPVMDLLNPLADSATEAEQREQLVQSANRTGCGHVGFLWRLTKGGDGWHCLACEPLPPAIDTELLNVARAPLHILEERLGQ